MSALRAPLLAPVPGSLPLVSLPSAGPTPAPTTVPAAASAAATPAPRAPSRTRGAIVVVLAAALAGLAFLLAKTL